MTPEEEFALGFAVGAIDARLAGLQGRVEALEKQLAGEGVWKALCRRAALAYQGAEDIIEVCEEIIREFGRRGEELA